MTSLVRTKVFFGTIVLLVVAGLIGSPGCSLHDPAPRKVQGDPQLELLNKTARLAFEKADYAGAVDIYQRTLKQALIRDELTEIVDARFNLAVSQLKLEDLAGARAQLEAAKNEFSLASLEVPQSFDLLEATLLYLEGKPAEAWSVTEGILAAADRTTPDVLGRTYYLRGRIASDRGETAGIRAAITAMGKPGDARLLADLEELTGRLAFSEQRWAAAVSALDRAAEQQRRLLDYHAMSSTLALSGLAYENIGDFAQAAYRYLQAGRSAALRGDGVRAREWLGHAITLADKSGNGNTAGEARELLTVLNHDSRRSPP